jgi:sucrose-phosphate synthase
VVDLLEAAGLRARVILSHGNFLDILPARAGKAAAMRWVAERERMRMEACMAAGDSGNDCDLLESCDRAIVVNNHSSELDHLLKLPNVYKARQPYADGVLEGMEAWSRTPAENRL